MTLVQFFCELRGHKDEELRRFPLGFGELCVVAKCKQCGSVRRYGYYPRTGYRYRL